MLFRSILTTLLVDDFSVTCTGSIMSSIELQLQLVLNQLTDWEAKSGFHFSRSKTVSMHFCRKRAPHEDPHLTLGNAALPVSVTTKYLGLEFDRRLTYINHLKNLKDRGSQALNIMKCLAHTSWGADRKTLTMLYQALIRSKLDYGCQVYSIRSEEHTSELQSP